MSKQEILQWIGHKLQTNKDKGITFLITENNLVYLVGQHTCNFFAILNPIELLGGEPELKPMVRIQDLVSDILC